MAGLRFSLAVFALCVAFAPWLSADVSRTTVPSSESVNSNTISLSPSLISATKFSTLKNHSTVVSSSKHNITTTFNMSRMTVTPSRNHSMTQNVTSTILHNMTTSSHKHTATLTKSHNMTAVTSTPYHNKTVSPVVHNSTVMPSHNMTIMPSSAHTVMPVSSSVAPTMPPLQRGNFSVSKNGSVCLIADMAVQFDVTYMKKNTTEKVKFNLPTSASSDGMCEKGSSSITLSWPQKEALFMLEMYFIKNSNVEETKVVLWEMDKLNLVINTTNNSMFPDAKESKLNFTFHEVKLKGQVGKAYKCEKGKLTYDLKDKTKGVNIEIQKYEFQPFNVVNGTLSDDVEHCPADYSSTTPSPTKSTGKPKSKSKVVPIAVGCSLAALVLIVLVGYLIGRRRSRKQSAGYRKL